MAFTIDKESLLIKGRRGDSASFTLNFDFDLSAYNVYFYVKKNIASSTTIIEKEYKNPSGTSLAISLTSADTRLLTSVANTFSTYYWGVKLSSGDDYVETIIPNDFSHFPMMLVYPEIGG